MVKRNAGWTNFLTSESRGLPTSERDRRRVNGLCINCGRALKPTSIDDARVTLQCSCGYLTEAVKGSKLYKHQKSLQEVCP